MKQIITLLRLLPRGTLPEYSLYAELHLVPVQVGEHDFVMRNVVRLFLGVA
jgi:hypothetical protein